MVPPTEPCALRSTQTLKVSTRDLSWGKGGWCVCLTTYHTCGAETSRKSRALIYPEPLGPPRPVMGDLYFTLLDGVWWSAPRPGPFTPRKDVVPIVHEAGWASEPVWTGAENFTPHQDSIPVPSSPVASRYTDYAIMALIFRVGKFKMYLL